MKTIGYLLGVALALCPLTLKADTWTDENGVEWRYSTSNGEATLGLGSSGNSYTAVPQDIVGAITIPSTLGGCLVTTVSAYAFSGCSEITKIILPPAITKIGSRAFYNCKKLSLTVPGRITSIGEAALYNVPTVFFEEGLTTLDFDAWRYSYNFSVGDGSTRTRYVYADLINDIYVPSTVETFANYTPSDNRINIKRMHIKGPYRTVPVAFCEKIYYDSEYAESWLLGTNNDIYKWTCEGSRLSVVSTLHGGTTSEKGKEVAWGEEVSVTAAAKEGYVFLGWDSDREGIEGTEETITFTMPQAPVTLVANFFPKALLEGWMDTRIDAKVDGERLMTADQAAEKTAAAIEGKVESGELFTPAGAEAKAAEEIAQKVANKELITADSLQEMALDAPVIEVDASGTAKVGISLQKASSLSGDWEEVALAEDAASVSAGALKLAVPAEEGTAFYKFVVPARQGAQEP